MSTPSAPGLRRSTVTSLAIVLCLTLVATATGWSRPVTAATNYLLMPRSELLGLPTSGSAWTTLKGVADQGLGTPDLCDQNADHHLRTLAAALVYARTGSSTHATKARAGVMAAIKTQVPGCGNAVLALGRQLTAYVLAADFADLSGTNDATFRSWLSTIRTKDVGGHSIWSSLAKTHGHSANNWGAHAGASRIAASLYLGDTTDVARAAKITRGFLGDRSAYSSFGHTLGSEALSWSCESASTFTPVNRACTKSGIDISGAVVADISRGGSLRWPPPSTGISYQVDSIQGVGLQVELLHRNGYGGAWGWSSSALKRAALLVVRSGNDGGDGWNESSASSQVPWLLNKRYGTSIPTRNVALGRGIGFAAWLWGGGSSSGGTTTTTAAKPVVATPRVMIPTKASISTSTVPSVVRWSLASSSNGVSRYQVQWKRDGGAWTNGTLATSTSTVFRKALVPGADYSFRVRAIDRSGRIGDWKAVGPFVGRRISDGSSALRYAGTWSTASATGYIGKRVHWTRTAGASVSYVFSGISVAWFGPVGPGRGQSRVYLDGKYVTTVDQYARSFVARRLLFARTVAPGTHTLKIVAVGTSGRPTVAIDGLYVIRPS